MVVDNEQSVDKDLLKFLLHEGVVNITFTKKDGTQRIMKATLVSDKIPKANEPKNDNPWRAKSEDVQAVYDLDNEGWRSFRWDSLVDFEVELSQLKE
jgi:hypothetical protein